MSIDVAKVREALRGNRSVHAWSLRHSRTQSVQTYLLAQGHESERQVEGESLEVAVHLRHDGVQGMTKLTLHGGEESKVAALLDQAVYMAGLGGDEPFDLAGAGVIPSVPLSDATLGADAILATSRGFADRWIAAVAKLDGGARPSSGELFLERTETRHENSAGFTGESIGSRLSLLTIILASGEGREAERISWEECRRGADLDVEAIVRDAAEEARDLTRATLPSSGSFPVVIDARDCRQLFSPIVQSSSAQSIYQKSSRFELGKALPGLEAKGDSLDLSSNALAPYGLGSYAFDDDGVPAQRVEVVKGGVFTQPWADQQSAAYTKLAATGAFANLEIAPGSLGFDELLSGGPLLYVRGFSWLTPDPGRGDFSSEIRIGYWIDAKGRRPIKGGSVSGNLFAGLSNARFSRETTVLGDYRGPRAVRFEGMAVTGA